MATLNAQQVYAAARGAGATHEEAVILTAIARGESGWNTNAHNPNAGTGDNSYGLWQINMLGSMGASRRRSFGISSNDALFNPATNAKAAVAILRSQGLKAWTVYSKGIYKQYLSEAQQAGSAAQKSWQKLWGDLGQGDYSAGGAMVIAANSGGASAGGGGGSMGGLPPNATPAQIEAYVRENYPQVAGFLAIPELKQVLLDAAKGEWTPTKLQAALQATQWWRTNGESVRNYYALKSSDPAQLKALIDAKKAELGPELQQLGLDPGGLAEEAIKYGMTSDQIRQYLGKVLKIHSAQGGLAQNSSVDVTADQLVAIARNDYLLPISRQDAERWAVDIYTGAQTEDGLRDYFGRMSAARFPGLADQGMTPGQFMAPVRNVVAQILEVDPGTIDFLDQRWAPLVETHSKDGFRPMTIAEAGRWARSQSAYRSTNGANDDAASLAEMIGKTFGAVA